MELRPGRLNWTKVISEVRSCQQSYLVITQVFRRRLKNIICMGLLLSVIKLDEYEVLLKVNACVRHKKRIILIWNSHTQKTEPPHSANKQSMDQ